MKHLIIFSSILFIGCSVGGIDPTDTVYISSRFDLDQIEVILRAADERHTTTNGSVSLKLRIGNEAGHFIQPKELEENKFGRTEASILTSYVNIYIDTKKLTKMSELKETIMHELMHGFGFQKHLAYGLMNSSRFVGACIDNNTINHYCNMNGCPNDFQTTCKE